jgi:hypothetical protein
MTLTTAAYTATGLEPWENGISYGYFVYEPFGRYQDSALGILHRNSTGQFGPTLEYLVTRRNPGVFSWLTGRDKLRPATLEDFDKYRLVVPPDYQTYAMAPVPTNPAQEKAMLQALADHLGIQPSYINVSAAVYNQGHWFTLAGENTALVGTIVEGSKANYRYRKTEYKYTENLIWNPEQPEAFLQDFDRALANCQAFAEEHSQD